MVADAIDEIGGDLVAVELREVDGPRAIDEVVVEFGDTADVTALSRALDAEPSAMLLSSQRCHRGEPASNAQDWARAARERVPRERGTDLSAQLRAACPMASVELRAPQDARDLPVVTMALARGGPVGQRRVTSAASTERPGGSTARWLMAAADSYTDVGRIALLERPMSLRFSAYDAARVDLLIGASRR
jgi:hypothetical protein